MDGGREKRGGRDRETGWTEGGKREDTSYEPPFSPVAYMFTSS